MRELGNLALIPARSGSKGLKDKNIKPLCGKPLLAYSIDAAKASGKFDTIYVSTDSPAYADIAREYGAEVPFLRSAETSSDTASSWDAVKEALDGFQRDGISYHTVTLLQPTAPLRTGEDIRKAFQIFEDRKACAVVGVCEADHSPLWYNTLPEDHSMTCFLNSGVSSRPRQELEQYYRINGAIYIIDTDYLLRCSSIYDRNCFAYIMDRKRSIDIDDQFDFKLAEAIMSMASDE